MKIATLVLLASLTLTGCSLIPKPVEFFQKKVQGVPAFTPADNESQREAAALAKQKAQDAVEAAIKEGSSTNVVTPAKDAAKLTDAVSTSLGPPVIATTNVAVADQLNKRTGKLNKHIDAAREAAEKVEGKKIEGTGLLQIPYFVYVGLIALVVLVGWHLAKLALAAASAANPGAAVGLAGMNVAGSVVSKGFHQLVQGGEAFKNWVEKEINDPNIKKSVLDAFSIFHKQAQDQDVKVLVDQVKK